MLVGIAMFGLITGLFIAVAGWQSKIWGVLGAGVLICGGGMFIGVFGTPSRDMPNGSPEMTMLGTIAMIMGVIVLVWQIAKVVSASKQQTEARLLEIGGTTLDKFFVECVLASYNDFSLEKNVAKAKLLADKYGLKYPNGIQTLYQSGLEAHKAISSQIDSDRLSKMRSVEKAEYDRLNRYASFYGKPWISTGLSFLSG